MVGSMKEKWQQFKNYFKKDEKIFAKGICFEKLFAIFLIGSIIGSFYEEILNFFLVYSRTGQFVWEYRRGVIYGPFNIIYGVGAVIIVALLADKKHKWYETILYGALLGGGIEYLISFLQETFTHTTSWDYSNKYLDINGRTTLPFMLIWGIFSFLFVRYLYPFISRQIEKIPYNLGKVLTKIFLVFMALNMAISWSAIIRQTLRKNNVPPLSPIGHFLDEHYDDEFLSKYFPNMEHHSKGD